MYYEVYQDPETRWRWKLIRKRSAQILAVSGESYANQVECITAISLVKRSADAPVVHQMGDPFTGPAG